MKKLMRPPALLWNSTLREQAMRTNRFVPAASLFCLAVLTTSLPAQENPAQDKAPIDLLAQDLKLLQGTWELVHGNEGQGAPTVRSIKRIEGQRETLRRYNVKTGALTHEHSVEFELTKSGAVRVFTFYAVGDNPKQGQSFVYKVDAENFYDIPGLLDDGAFRNYQASPTVWHWKRVKDVAADPSAAGQAPALAVPVPMPVAKPLPEVPAEVRGKLEALGAKIDALPDGYRIDVRRRPLFTDAALDVLVQCPEVVDLTMERVSLTDRGLAKLEGLPRLRRLILNDCPLTSEGVRTLATLPLRESLITLGVRGTKLKDAELDSLKMFTKLERLDISQTAITDASLPVLEALPLRFLSTGQTALSADALEGLQKKHPKLILQR
jgi:hypothetical protein